MSASTRQQDFPKRLYQAQIPLEEKDFRQLTLNASASMCQQASTDVIISGAKLRNDLTSKVFFNKN